MNATLTVDEQTVLADLARAWGAVYRTSRDSDGKWRASRKDGTGEPLAGATPDDLTAALRADWGAW